MKVFCNGFDCYVTEVITDIVNDVIGFKATLIGVFLLDGGVAILTLPCQKKFIHKQEHETVG